MTDTFADWSLVIHGGSGRMTRATVTAAADAAFRAGLSAALAVGATILAAGGTALDAVDAAVTMLEDDLQFNAGRGAVFTADGHIELDAAIMDGRTRAAGAVAGVTRTRNPVRLARAVMETTPHILLTRDGADDFALQSGLEQVDPAWFHTALRQQALEAMQAAAARGEPVFDKTLKYGTVGAAARDDSGNLAAATSTGGLTGKRWGRIGDTPLIGAGTFADNRSVAMSATGSGEDFIRAGVGHEIGARVRLLGTPPQAAADAVIAELRAADGDGGVIFVGHDGSAGWSFNTPSMLRGCVTASQKPLVAIFADER